MRNLGNIKRVVIKVGTAVISRKDNTLNKDYFKSLSRQVAKLRKNGIQVLIVSSGAISAGINELDIKQISRDIKIMQMCASVGQATLMNEYKKHFSKYNINIAQVLLTYNVFHNRKTFLNLRNCVDELLRNNIIPIFNENDVVSIDEINASFGDNDYLSALIATSFDAELLLMLSGVSGLHTRNPKKDKHAKLIKEVTEITPEMKRQAKGKSRLGLGGMDSKLEAAKKCMHSGTSMILADGNEKDIIIKAVEGRDVGTVFYSNGGGKSSKERWILITRPEGTIEIDSNAEKALRKGKNLLPVGIVRIEGRFSKGNIVDIKCNKNTIGKLVTEHSAEELRKGLNSHGNVNKKGNIVIL